MGRAAGKLRRQLPTAQQGKTVGRRNYPTNSCRPTTLYGVNASPRGKPQVVFPRATDPGTGRWRRTPVVNQSRAGDDGNGGLPVDILLIALIASRRSGRGVNPSFDIETVRYRSFDIIGQYAVAPRPRPCDQDGPHRSNEQKRLGRESVGRGHASSPTGVGESRTLAQWRPTARRGRARSERCGWVCRAFYRCGADDSSPWLRPD
jgi:hypothetical protein